MKTSSLRYLYIVCGVIVVSCALGLSTLKSDYYGEEATQQRIQAARDRHAHIVAVLQNMARERKPLLNRIEERYGYRPQYTVWGKTPTALVPRAAWKESSEYEKHMLASIAMNDSEWQVIVGEVKSSNDITIDETVASGFGIEWFPENNVLKNY